MATSRSPLSRKSLSEFVRQQRQLVVMHEGAKRVALAEHRNHDAARSDGLMRGILQVTNDLVEEYGLTIEEET